MSRASKVSFTVRRPTPLSRPSSTGPDSNGQFKVPALPRHLTSRSSTSSPLAGSRDVSDDDSERGIVFSTGGIRGSGAREPDSSDDDDASVEETLVTEFDQVSVQRSHDRKSKAPEPVLVIPSLPNPDWREAARKRRAAARPRPSFVPNSALAVTGADGSVGGLGTRDTINSGPQLSGLQTSRQVEVEANGDVVGKIETTTTVVETTQEHNMEVEETEDQKALRALLAGEGSSSADIDAIPVPALSETDALRQDVEVLPDCATAEDYARVPVSAFGIAMLRGMGWTEGTVASRSEKGKKHGLLEPYLPQARPALLGIGAKEREPDDDGSGKKKRAHDKRYIPLVRKDGGEESGGSRSGAPSRRTSRSPPAKTGDEARVSKSRHDDRDRRGGRGRDYEERSRGDRECERRGWERGKSSYGSRRQRGSGSQSQYDESGRESR